MDKKLQNKLFKKYPKIFAGAKKGAPKSCMSEGITCGDGWYKLIDRLCQALQFDTDTNKRPQVVADQVKEKLGTLRFYAHGGDARQHAMIDFACQLSDLFCEDCGTNQDVTRSTTSWISYLCPECRKKDKA